jgi:non-homologous end joining protein Ku
VASPARAGEPDEGDDEEQGREEAAEENEQEKAHLVPHPKNTRTIEIQGFVPPGQVDVRYFEKPYYVVPRAPSPVWLTVCECLGTHPYLLGNLVS